MIKISRVVFSVCFFQRLKYFRKMYKLQIGLTVLGTLTLLFGFNLLQGFRLNKMGFSIKKRRSLISINKKLNDEDHYYNYQYNEYIDEPDPGCEGTIGITFNRITKGINLLPYIERLYSIRYKPIRIFMKTKNGKNRFYIHPNEIYTSMQVAILLANRSGPLTAIQWSETWKCLQDMTNYFNSSIDIPNQEIILDRANQLDALCKILDFQIVLTLILNNPKSGSIILDKAYKFGFIFFESRLIWLSKNGSVSFYLESKDSILSDTNTKNNIRYLNLVLDIPNSFPHSRLFGYMVEISRNLANFLDANLVDDQGKALSYGIETIVDNQLQKIFQSLYQANLPAGSLRAQRVFS